MAQLTGVTDNNTSTIADLNAIHSVDWLKYSTGGIITKNGGGSTIVASSGGFDTSSSPIGRTIGWTNGTPTASGSDDNGRFDGAADTFQLPASTAVRTAVFYLGTSDFSAGVVQFTITASLSDSSAGPYSFTTTGANAQWNITLTYAAASPGQTLNITVTPTTSWAYFQAVGYSLAGGGIGPPSDLAPWVPRRPAGSGRRSTDALPLPRKSAPSWQTDAPPRAPRSRPRAEGVTVLPALLAFPTFAWAPPPGDPRPPRPNRTQPESPLPVPVLLAPPVTAWTPESQIYTRAYSRRSATDAWTPSQIPQPPPGNSNPTPRPQRPGPLLGADSIPASPAAPVPAWAPDGPPTARPSRRSPAISSDVLIAQSATIVRPWGYDPSWPRGRTRGRVTPSSDPLRAIDTTVTGTIRPPLWTVVVAERLSLQDLNGVGAIVDVGDAVMSVKGTDSGIAVVDTSDRTGLIGDT